MLLKNLKHLLHFLKAVKPSPDEACKCKRAFLLTIWWHHAHKHVISETEFRKLFNVQSQRERHLLTACQTAGHIPFYLAPYPTNMSHPFFSSCRCNELWEDPVHLPGLSPAPGGFPPHSGVVSQLVCCPRLLLVGSWIFWGCSLSCSHCFFQFTGFFFFFL